MSNLASEMNKLAKEANLLDSITQEIEQRIKVEAMTGNFALMLKVSLDKVSVLKTYFVEKGFDVELLAVNVYQNEQILAIKWGGNYETN